MGRVTIEAFYDDGFVRINRYERVASGTYLYHVQHASDRRVRGSFYGVAPRQVPQHERFSYFGVHGRRALTRRILLLRDIYRSVLSC